MPKETSKKISNSKSSQTKSVKKRSYQKKNRESTIRKRIAQNAGRRYLRYGVRKNAKTHVCVPRILRNNIRL